MSLKTLNIRELASFIKQCETTGAKLNRQSREKLGKARLKMACWVCKTEGIEPTLDNIAGILGTEFKTVVPFISEIKIELGADGPKI